MPDKDSTITFLRKRDYKFIRNLGRGACGETILLHDDMIDEYFVCKKYAPQFSPENQELFQKFKQEIKILYKLNHTNVVRVYNYYLFPQYLSGYILMEFVDGVEIDKYLDKHPERINEIFLQSIKGFCYLESQNVLHRDIRPENLMVGADNGLKIIDLGFGKVIQSQLDFDNSLSLNWRYSPPEEFNRKEYNYATEVYFVGKLFEEMIQDLGIDSFNFTEVLSKMCRTNPATRISGFSRILSEIKSNYFSETDFSATEISSYQEFSDTLFRHITKIHNRSKYLTDIRRIQTNLENAYRSTKLEIMVPSVAIITQCFIIGTYYYHKNGFSVDTLRNFVTIFKSCSEEKKSIILANLHRKLDAIPRYNTTEDDDDIPF